MTRSTVLPVSYEKLMQAAGYLRPGKETVAAFANTELSLTETRPSVPSLRPPREQSSVAVANTALSHAIQDP